MSSAASAGVNAELSGASDFPWNRMSATITRCFFAKPRWASHMRLSRVKPWMKITGSPWPWSS